MVNGIVFSDQLMTSSNFAHFVWTFLNHANGITKGCGITHTTERISIAAGYFFTFGRMVQIEGVETVKMPEVQSGQMYCRLVFEVDLSKENTAEAFNQGYFKILTNASATPPMTQEDLDNGGKVYQMPWATFTKTASGVNDFKDERPIIDMSDLWNGAGFLKTEAAKQVIDVTLAASDWAGSVAPFTQTVKNSKITSSMDPLLIKRLSSTANVETARAYNKAFGLVSSGTAVTNNGSVTFKVYKKPATTITVGLKGAY